jgi:DNA-binding LacI/PurR family transcriptional regulator
MTQDSELPLHVQVRRGLTHLIEDYFEEGQPFWTETLLTERLQVSRITVRRALADLKSSGVLEGKAAKGTFVRKRRSAESSSVAFTTIGLVVNSRDSAFILDLLERLTALCRANNLKIRTYFTRFQDTVAEVCGYIEGSPREERLIMLGFSQEKTEEISQAFAELGYQGVLMDMLNPHTTWSYIGSDNEIGMRLGLEHLLSLGHRRIALLVSEPETAWTVQARIAAFERICHESGRPGDYPIVRCPRVPGLVSFEVAYQNMPRLMETNPTAIFAVSDSGAWAALRYLAEKGISVPGQMSVIGFDDERPSRFTTPALTTVAHPMDEIVAGAVRLLKENNATRRYLTPQLVVRQSAAPPPIT